jgi:hypothetical protein
MRFDACRFPAGAGGAARIANSSVGGELIIGTAQPAIAFTGVAFPAGSGLVVEDVVVARRPHYIQNAGYVASVLIGFTSACTIGANVTHVFRNVSLRKLQRPHS